MRFGVFSVWDSKAELFSSPMLSVNKGTMMRTLSDVLNDPSHQYAKHPEDFVLYELGEFDDQRGEFHLHPASQSICVLRDLRLERE